MNTNIHGVSLCNLTDSTVVSILQIKLTHSIMKYLATAWYFTSQLRWYEML